MQNGMAGAGLKRIKSTQAKKQDKGKTRLPINRDAGKNESSMAGGGFSRCKNVVGCSSTMFLWVLEIWGTHRAIRVCI